MRCARCGGEAPEGARLCVACDDKARAELAASIAPGTLLAGRYRVRGFVAEGAAGPVFRARDQEVDLEIAVKLFDPALAGAGEQVETLRAVVQARRGLRHPSLPRIYDFGIDAGRAFYTTPFLEGLTLREVMDVRAEKGLTFALSEALPLLRQLGEAMQALEPGGAHGAVRPTSVIVLSDVLELTGSPHLAGLPRAPLVARIAERGEIAYLAPEAREPEGQIGPESDVYSLAVIATEMLAGVAGSLEPATWAIARERLAAPVAEVLERGLAREIAKRQSHAADLVASLSDLVVSTPGLPVPIPRPQGVARPHRPTPSRVNIPAIEPPAGVAASGGGRRGLLIAASVGALVLAGVGVVAARMLGGGGEATAQAGAIAAVAPQPAAQPAAANVQEPIFETLELEPGPVPADVVAGSGSDSARSGVTGDAAHKAVKGVLKPRRGKTRTGKRADGSDAVRAGGDSDAAPGDADSGVAQNGSGHGTPPPLPLLAARSPQGTTALPPAPPPPPPLPPDRSTDRQADVLTPPVLISGPDVEYTVEAFTRRIRGEVVVSCIIGADGRVRQCRIVKPLAFMDGAVKKAIEARHYEPAKRNGQPVDMPYTFDVHVGLPSQP